MPMKNSKKVHLWIWVAMLAGTVLLACDYAYNICPQYVSDAQTDTQKGMQQEVQP